MRTIIAITVAALATASFAQDLLWSGDTTGQATFNRPLSFTGQSGVGTAVAFEVCDFWVDTSGEYVFEIDGVSHTDTYALVYAGSFDSTNPLVNLIAGDDDYSAAFTVLTGTGQGFASSRIALGEATNYGGATTGLNLTAGVQYYAVVTGYGNGDFGTYDAGIGDGPGTVNRGAVPEPATMAVLGLGALALIRRRKA